MSTHTTARFGSIMAILAGILLFVGTGSYIFWPKGMIFAGSDFYRLVLSHVALYRFTYLTLALSALASLAVVMSLRDLLHRSDHGLLRWASLLALIGFTVTAVNFVYIQSAAPLQAENYVGQHSAYQGIGVFMDRDEGGEITLAPLPNSPADQAGIQTGDVLVSLNEQAVPQNASIDTVQAQIRSLTGEPLTLTVRSGDQPERQVKLSRGSVAYWDVAIQKSIQASMTPNLDPNYLLGFGLPGIWLIILNSWALRSKCLPALLAGLGIVAGLAYWLFVSGFLLGSAALILAGQFGGLTLGPAWFICAGFAIRKEIRD